MNSRRITQLVPVLIGLLFTGSGALTHHGEARDVAGLNPTPSTAEATQQTASSAIQTPEQFFGFQMGADRKLANWDKLHAYYQLLAMSSN